MHEIAGQVQRRDRHVVTIGEQPGDSLVHRYQSVDLTDINATGECPGKALLHDRRLAVR